MLDNSLSNKNTKMEQHADYSWKVPDMQHNGH